MTCYCIYNQLPPAEQEPIRFQVTKHIQKLYTQSQIQEHRNICAHIEKKLIHRIKEKLTSNNAVIVKADKGNTLVIEFQNSYYNKIQTFIDNNDFTELGKDPTKKFQKQIRTSINTCQQIINRNTKWNYFNLNPAPLNIRGLIKIHKNNNPIRPIINWAITPAYKLARKITKDLKKHIPLPNNFNVKNTIQLINELMDIPYENNIKLASFDITNMYTNIPTNELPNIILNLCNNNYINPTTQPEILHLCSKILKQNYFQFQDSFFIQNTGLAMGNPTSSILSEIYLQFLYIQYSQTY